MDRSKPVKVPLLAGTILQRYTDEFLETSENIELSLLSDREATAYRQLVGSLIYLANGTRFDISFAIGQLARQMSSPRQLHLYLGKQVLRYLRGSHIDGVTYQFGCQTAPYDLYLDATWGSKADRKLV